MSNHSAVLDEAPAAPAITPETLRKVKKEDMKQAIVERFKIVFGAPASGTGKERKRSPYWQAADEEC
jgi:hypothetical protein